MPSVAESPVVLELTNVACAYDAGRPAIQGISFAARRGDVIGLLGPSGCGKTTTLRAIAGFEPVAEGEISINGTPVAAVNRHVPPERRQVGMVFQDYALFPHLTVRENVGFGVRRGPAVDRRRRIDEMLEMTGLTDLARRYPHALSGGQQQRVALARALAPAPVLLLLDEPFSNLDPDMTYRMRGDLLRLLNTTRTTAVLVTHDHEEALGMADTVAVLRHGCLEQCAAPETVYHLPASPFVAECVGQADFIPGAIRDAVVHTPLGNFFVPPDYPGGPEVVVMIRPDDVRIDDAGPWAGTIHSRQFQGADMLYGILLESGDLVHGSAPSTQLLPLDARVRLRIDAAHTVVFDRHAERSRCVCKRDAARGRAPEGIRD